MAAVDFMMPPPIAICPWTTLPSWSRGESASLFVMPKRTMTSPRKSWTGFIDGRPSANVRFRSLAASGTPTEESNHDHFEEWSGSTHSGAGHYHVRLLWPCPGTRTSYERRARGGHSRVQYTGKQISGTCLGHRGNSGVSDLHGRASPDGIARNFSRQHHRLRRPATALKQGQATVPTSAGALV